MSGSLNSMSVVSNWTKPFRRLNALRSKAEKWAMTEYLQWKMEGVCLSLRTRLLIDLVLGQSAYLFLLILGVVVVVLHWVID